MMNPYRFSPIQDKTQLMEAITYIHVACHELCKQTMGKYLPVAGNIGVFCHYDDEYEFLKKLQAELVDLSKSVYGKYYWLHESIVIPARDDVPETTYRYLYIRKPDTNKDQVGDVDFYLESEKHAALKQSLFDGKLINGARVLANRPELDFIELFDPNVDAWGYVGKYMWQ